MDKRRNIKIVFFSDTHLGLDYKVNKNSKANKGEDYFNNFTSVIQRAKEIKADLLIHGGDLFNKADIHQRVIDRCYDQLYTAADQMPCVLIPGNHDKGKLPESLFTSHPNLHIANKDQQFTFEFNNLDIEVSALPFKKSIRKNIIDSLDSFKKVIRDKKYNILLMHQSIEGAQVGPVNYTFTYSSETISQKQVPSYYDLVLSGHIHRHQIINIKNEDKTIPFVYSGSTEKTSFAEKGEQKGFVVLEFKRNETIPEIRFEKLNSRPMHELLIEEKFLSATQIKNYLEKNISHIENKSIVRIDCIHDETKKLLNQKALADIFPSDTIIVIKGISSLYRYPKYIKNYDK